METPKINLRSFVGVGLRAVAGAPDKQVQVMYGIQGQDSVGDWEVIARVQSV